MIMRRNRNENRVGKRLVSAGAAGILAAGMLTAAVLAGAAPAGAAPAPHKPAAGSLPPIRSASGQLAPGSASGSGGWHVARARSGHGQSSAKALHVFLPRTNKLVAPSGSSRSVPQPA